MAPAVDQAVTRKAGAAEWPEPETVPDTSRAARDRRVNLGLPARLAAENAGTRGPNADMSPLLGIGRIRVGGGEFNMAGTYVARPSARNDPSQPCWLACKDAD